MMYTLVQVVCLSVDLFIFGIAILFSYIQHNTNLGHLLQIDDPYTVSCDRCSDCVTTVMCDRCFN
jgi:hypothetical protein